jgi:hypothetical protein
VSSSSGSSASSSGTSARYVHSIFDWA